MDQLSVGVYLASVTKTPVPRKLTGKIVDGGAFRIDLLSASLDRCLGYPQSVCTLRCVRNESAARSVDAWMGDTATTGDRPWDPETLRLAKALI